VTHSTRVRIYYEDTDCGGVVYYANYLRYFERARTHFLEELGLDLTRLMNEGILFAVVNAGIDYMAPARYGDTLLIRTDITGVGAASVAFSHEVTREPDGALIARSVIRMACLDTVGQVRRLDEGHRNALRDAVEAGASG